jgi:hypothetical protein
MRRSLLGVKRRAQSSSACFRPKSTHSLVFKSSHTGVGTSILWYRSPHRQVHQYSQRRGGPTNTSPVLGASPGRPLTALSPTPGTDRLWARPDAETAHAKASPMRIAGRYLIAFPLKAAYQGWLDEASSDLIPGYQTEAQRLPGRSLDGPEAAS